jgi:hypothetical protein
MHQPASKQIVYVIFWSTGDDTGVELVTLNAELAVSTMQEHETKDHVWGGMVDFWLERHLLDQPMSEHE